MTTRGLRFTDAGKVATFHAFIEGPITAVPFTAHPSNPLPWIPPRMELCAAIVTSSFPFRAFFRINGKFFRSCPDSLLKRVVHPCCLFEFTCLFKFTSRCYSAGGLSTTCRSAAERCPSERPNDPVSHQPMTLLKHHDCGLCMFPKHPINFQDRIGACLVEPALKLCDHRTSCT